MRWLTLAAAAGRYGGHIMSVSVPGHYSHNVKSVKKARVRQSAR